MQCSKKSFDHLVGAQQDRCRQLDADRLGGLEIDDEIELGRLLDPKVGRLRPAQNLVNVVGGAPKQAREVRCIGHQTSRLGQRLAIDSEKSPYGWY